MRWDWLDQRPLVVALAGSTGAGKTTFFRAHLADTGLRFVNADELARGLALQPYEAARLADGIRRALVAKGESFSFDNSDLRAPFRLESTWVQGTQQSWEA